MGYRVLRSGDIDRALEIFTLNAETFPDAFNTWDSLAEAYMRKGDDDRALAYYRKSLELNPGNQNAKNMIARIEARRREQ